MNLLLGEERFEEVEDVEHEDGVEPDLQHAGTIPDEGLSQEALSLETVPKVLISCFQGNVVKSVLQEVAVDPVVFSINNRHILYEQRDARR